MTTSAMHRPTTRLRRLLAEGGGRISFERFFAAALYDPRVGYYTTAVPSVGRRGDFSTAATLDPALGNAVAAWARARRRELLPPGPWHLIELGGGSGSLARAVLAALGWPGRRRLTYHLVEISPALEAVQRQQLGHRRGHRRVRWHRAPREALEAAGSAALIFSNELVDAFPPKLLTFREGAWREVFLELRQGRLVEVFAEPSDPRLLSSACSLPSGFANPPEGQRIEVHLAYRDWLAGWLPGLCRGSMLTLDYGDTAERLYHRRKGGTLRAYFRHFRFDGPEIYERFARQDLTADVDFTDLIRWGEELGLATRGFTTQRDFLLTWSPRLASRPSPAADFLLSPEGAGEAFKVLEQSRDASGQPA